MIYKAFTEQIAFHRSKARVRGVFAGRRGGKTECGAIEAIIHTEQQLGYQKNEVDPYLGVIIAPTIDMARRLSLAKFLGYAAPFKHTFNKSNLEIQWHNGSKIYVVSADKPQRLEGLKANWIWIDEVFQVPEQIFLESMARTSDTLGRIWVTGSLGVQYNNPKNHFCFKYFKENQYDETECFEWPTVSNPYFPKGELERLKDVLDPRTFRQMFTIDWSIPGTNLVYDQFDDSNIIADYVYKPEWETLVSIDWGWTHPTACLFYQYDKQNDVVYLFDEIVQSKMDLDALWDKIKAKGYKIDYWCCDIAGNQERLEAGRSCVNWFKDQPRGINFKYRQTAINYGIPIVRSYIRNGLGQCKFYMSKARCPKSIDGIMNYRYAERNGIIQEIPEKIDDDCVDSIRYLFVNRFDKMSMESKLVEFQRWGTWRF